MFLQHLVARGRTMSSNQIVEGFEFCYLIGLWSCCCCNRNLQEQKCKRCQVWERDWEPTQVDISRNVAKLHRKHLVALTRTTHPLTNCMVLFYVHAALYLIVLRIRNRILNQYGKKEFSDTNWDRKLCWRFNWMLQSSSFSFCTWLHNLCNRVQNSMHVKHWFNLLTFWLKASVLIRKTEAFSRNVSKVSDLKVGIREHSFSFMQEPTEKQPLRVNQCSLSTVPSPSEV